MKNVRDNFKKFLSKCIKTFKIECYQNYVNNLMRHRSIYDFLDSNRSENTPKDISLSLISDFAKEYNIHHIEVLPFSIIQIIDDEEVCHMFRVRKSGNLYDIELSIAQISEWMRKLDYTRYLIEMRIDKKSELDYHLEQIVKFISNRSNQTQEFFTKYSMSNECWENISKFNNILDRLKMRYKNVVHSTLNDRVYDIIIKTRNLIRKVEIDYNVELIQVTIKTERIIK